MKPKKVKEKLQQRIKWYERLTNGMTEDQAAAFTKPGSLNQKKG